MSSSRNFETRGRKSGRIGCVFPVLLVLALLVGLVIYIVHMNPDPEIRVAQVCALPTQTAIPSMDIVVTLYNKDGNPVFTHPPYVVQGNLVELQGTVIAYPTVVTYKLTGLQAHYKDPRLERSRAHTLIPLNNGEDGFYHIASILPTVTPSSNSLLVPTDGYTYNIYAKAGGLFASRVNVPPGCGLNHQTAG